VQRQPEQPAFVEAFVQPHHAGAQIQKRPGRRFPCAVEKLDGAYLVGHQEAARPVAQGDKGCGGGEPLGEQAEADGRGYLASQGVGAKN
jgi:hypothetical protein